MKSAHSFALQVLEEEFTLGATVLTVYAQA
jgi:hypothetical protein